MTYAHVMPAHALWPTPTSCQLMRYDLRPTPTSCQLMRYDLRPRHASSCAICI